MILIFTRGRDLLLLVFLLSLFGVTGFAQSSKQAPPKFLFAISSKKDPQMKLGPLSCAFINEKNNEIYVGLKDEMKILVYDLDGYFLNEIQSSEFGYPASIALDSQGNLYVLDGTSPRVTVVDFNGTLLNKIDLSQLPDGTKAIPFKVVYCENGDLILGDNIEKRILRIDSSGGIVSQFDFSKPFEGKLQVSSDFAIDRWGRFYILDRIGSIICVFDSKGKFQFKFGVAGGGPGTLSLPEGIVIDSKDRVYVVSHARHTVLVYDITGKYLYEFGGCGDAEGWFDFPRRVCIDGKNRLYFTELYNNRLQIFQIIETATPTAAIATETSQKLAGPASHPSSKANTASSVVEYQPGQASLAVPLAATATLASKADNLSSGSAHP